LVLAAATKLDVARAEATAANAMRDAMRREYEKALALIKASGLTLPPEPIAS
jgi:uncharacterized protein YggE